MDIQVSSNFERLLYEILKRDTNKLNFFMNRFTEDNYFTLDQDYIDNLKKVFLAFKVSDLDIINTIKNIFN